MSHTIKAVKADHSLAGEEDIIPDAPYEMDYDVSDPATVDNLAGMKNLLNDTLYQMGYGDDDNLVNTLITRDVIDFDRAEYTSHIMDQLIEHYGEEVLCGGLVLAVAREGLKIELRDADEQNWRSLRWESLEKYIPYIILDEVESLGLSVANGQNLKESQNLSKCLSQVKRNLLIDYGGEFGCQMPDVDIVIYRPDTCKVLAVVSGNITSKRVDQTIKLAQDGVTKHIKAYFIGSNEDGTLGNNNPLAWDRAFIESDLDRNYVLFGLDRSYLLTEANTEDSEKVKLFERFIEDLKETLNLDINRDVVSNTR